jgi:putative ubiquitin-RnfH superfamily antitoxin RatB of RatAB toxin-antitoxin module
MASEDRVDRIRVAVACSPSPGLAVEVDVWVRPGASLGEAIRESGLVERFAGCGLEDQATGVWGRPCPPETPLRPGDRVELYRPLAMDPKEARRLRASRPPKRGR